MEEIEEKEYSSIIGAKRLIGPANASTQSNCQTRSHSQLRSTKIEKTTTTRDLFSYVCRSEGETRISHA